MNVVINVDKPQGLTSHGVCRRVRAELGVNKTGHTGTLDPLATGVLLVCCNRATKLVNYLVGLDKEYVVRMRLGVETDTLDGEGLPVKEMPVPPLTTSVIENALGKYRGEIMQQPPMYSAIKVGGVPLYKMARRGIEVERKVRRVNIREIELTQLTLPFVELRVLCSKGVYIRTLCCDIARDIGTCGYVDSLRRRRVGDFDVGQGVQLGQLGEPNLAGGYAGRGYHNMDDALGHLREVALTFGEVRRLTSGQTLTGMASVSKEGQCVRVKDPDGRLVAVASVTDKGIRMSTLLADI
ncbi:tRNA pseudouridine synthase B [Candidatus Magnetobacterium bavaricum]|uniref:tRNA pseudouridine synthase B n=1 Tax=Candidatus Magnetobacterium bavaricum TaxID=29290 RepID=A0A0F3GKD3_9BACT|nr:tRNA pseudouridine synthase B [Candidatus Magnetobacterium bavaricum]